MKKSAVFVGTRNVYDDIVPAVKALLINSDVDEIYLLVEDDEFPLEIPSCVKPINVSQQPYFRHDGPNYNLKWTYMTLMRAALAKVLPDVDVVLSMDNDAIALRDVSDVWNLPLDDCYYAAAREPLKSEGGDRYRCDYYAQMGVVLFNLKKLREDGMVDRVIESLNDRFWSIAEQDCFNSFCQGHICQMPAEYCVCDYTEQVGVPKIIHYAAIKEWNHKPLVDHYRNIQWEDVLRMHEEMKR